jgi:DNA-directed RNA polymerase beta subunit
MATEFLSTIAEAEKRLEGKYPEAILGKSLLQPGTNLNSGSRKLMFSVHADHRLMLLNGEKAILETGYENKFGDYSSSILKTDHDFKVVAKISKFTFAPNHHYYLIMEDPVNKILDVVERISYHHVTESYGYVYNNTTLDSIQVGQMIPKDTILQKSLSFDEYMNRIDGVNFNVAYMSLDKNMEDSIIYSDVAAEKLTSPLIKPVEIMINENDIPLNLYGDDKLYKAIPDIGEDVKDSILIALRKEKKEESVYTQSAERLRHTMMSDTKFTLTGKVIDVNIYCNNPQNLDGYYTAQFKMYYEQNMRMSAEIVSAVTQYVASGYTLSYDIQKLFANARRVLNKDQYMGKKLFSNMAIEVVVLEERKIQAGDKASNRYGGKGVISCIVPQKMMPREVESGRYVDVILNSNGEKL